MSKRTFSTIALIGGLATLGATGCGSSDDGKPIPAAIRQQLEVQLQETNDRLENGSAGACADITSETEPDVDRILDRVPNDVDQDVRDALNEGFARLFELVSNRCDALERRQSDTDTDTTETTPPDTGTTETPPSETETTPPEPTETETTPEQPTTPGNDTGTGDGNNGNDDAGGGAGGDQLPGDDGGAATPPGEG